MVAKSKKTAKIETPDEDHGKQLSNEEIAQFLKRQKEKNKNIVEVPI